MLNATNTEFVFEALKTLKNDLLEVAPDTNWVGLLHLYKLEK